VTLVLRDYIALGFIHWDGDLTDSSASEAAGCICRSDASAADMAGKSGCLVREMALMAPASLAININIVTNLHHFLNTAFRSDLGRRWAAGAAVLV
jgi:hypothetical protein